LAQASFGSSFGEGSPLRARATRLPADGSSLLTSCSFAADFPGTLTTLSLPIGGDIARFVCIFSVPTGSLRHEATRRGLAPTYFYYKKRSAVVAWGVGCSEPLFFVMHMGIDLLNLDVACCAI